MRILKTGDPCPFCGQPLRQTDPYALRLSALQNQKMQEYISLMSHYDGAPLMDVPEDVFVRAHAALKKARAADMKWRKLMGFPTDPPAGKKRRAASSG